MSVSRAYESRKGGEANSRLASDTFVALGLRGCVYRSHCRYNTDNGYSAHDYHRLLRTPLGKNFTLGAAMDVTYGVEVRNVDKATIRPGACCCFCPTNLNPSCPLILSCSFARHGADQDGLPCLKIAHPLTVDPAGSPATKIGVAKWTNPG